MHVTGKDAMGKPGKIASYAVVTHQHSTIRRAVDRYWQELFGSSALELSVC